MDKIEGRKGTLSVEPIKEKLKEGMGSDLGVKEG